LFENHCPPADSDVQTIPCLVQLTLLQLGRVPDCGGSCLRPVKAAWKNIGDLNQARSPYGRVRWYCLVWTRHEELKAGFNAPAACQIFAKALPSDAPIFLRAN